MNDETKATNDREQTGREQTEGEYRVGVEFNPSALTSVDNIKQKAAELINLVALHGRDNRCTALAQTAIEEGAMWAVKSATKPERK